MSRDKLPMGVPPDNSSYSGGNESGFRAPDMATPKFLRDQQSLRRVERHEVEIVEDDDDDEFEDNHHERRNPGRLSPASNTVTQIVLIAAIGVVLTILAAMIISNGRQPMPLCSTLPDWNQYNCRAG